LRERVVALEERAVAGHAGEPDGGELAPFGEVPSCSLFADATRQPLMFPKEKFSNGCIGTVDVPCPQAFHSYRPAAELRQEILELKKFATPVKMLP
jgi:hypothetical protein